MEGGLSTWLVRQTKDINSVSVVRLSCAPPRRRGGHEGMDMPALREISFEQARTIAADKGLQPSKVKGTNTLRFSKTPSDKLQVITWAEFERTASGRRLAVYESAGWMKLMTRH